MAAAPEELTTKINTVAADEAVQTTTTPMEASLPVPRDTQGRAIGTSCTATSNPSMVSSTVSKSLSPETTILKFRMAMT